MKIAKVKNSLRLALCASILLTFSTFSAFSITSDDGEPPLSKTTSRRLAAYKPFFDEIKTCISDREINMSVEVFMRNNFQGKPTLADIDEFKSHLSKSGLRFSAIAHIKSNLNKRESYLDSSEASTHRSVTPSSNTRARRHLTTLREKRLAIEISHKPPTLDPTNRARLDDIAQDRELRASRIALINKTLVDSKKLETPTFLPSIPDITHHLNVRIIGQEEAMNSLAVRVHRHYTIQRLNKEREREGLEPFKKSTILMCGPTGCGKTASIRAIAQLMNKPFVDGDSSSITPAGYKGNNFETLFQRLIVQAEEKAKKIFPYGSSEYHALVQEFAEEGMIYLDEIDKIAAGSKGGDFKDEPVQDELLKPLDTDGTRITIIHKNGSLAPVEYTLNTRKILFVTSGAFTELDKTKDPSWKAMTREEQKRANHPTLDDFKAAGFKAELLGRLGGDNPIVLHDLSEETYLRILRSSAVSPVLNNLDLLKKGYEVTATFREDAIKELARRVILLQKSRQRERSRERKNYKYLWRQDEKKLHERI